MQGDLRLAQQTVCLRRGQPFIPQMYRQTKPLSQVFGKVLHLSRLGALGSAHSQRIAHHNLRHLILPDHFSQFSKVRLLVLALQGFEALGGNPQRIRNGYTDSPRTDI